MTIFMSKTAGDFLEYLKPSWPGGRWLAGVIAVFTIGVGSAGADSLNYATPYNFVTIAGNSASSGNVDGTNGIAQFSDPAGIAIGTNGNVYVVDNGESTVRQLVHMGTNWVVTTIAGSAGNFGAGDGTNNNAQFGDPSGIAADGLGNFFVTDTYFDTIRRVSHVGTNWVVTTIAGNAANSAGDADGTNGNAQFNTPYGIAVDSGGNLYVADSFNNIIRRIVPVGTNWVVTTIAGFYDPNNVFGSSIDGTNQAAQFSTPTALTVDVSGNLFVADGGSGLIRKITAVGTNWVVTTINGSTGAADGTNGTIRLSAPFYGICVDTNDNLYVADTYNYLIRKVSPVGTNWVSATLAGMSSISAATDGTGTNATFGYPWGIALDTAGYLYVSDLSNHDIRRGAIAGLPNLTIISTGLNSVLVSWPGSFGTLQTNANLATGNWGVYGGTVSSANGTNSATIPAATGNLFFRLSN